MPGDLDLDDEPKVKGKRTAATSDGKPRPNKEYESTAGELTQFVERYEQLDSEAKEIADQKKELMAEAKGRGFDTKIMKKVIALRKRKADEIAEEQAVLQTYLDALSMDLLGAL